MQGPQPLVSIRFGNGQVVNAPSALWIAWLIDTLHPMQQEHLQALIIAAQEAQQNQPLVQIAG